MNDAIAELAYTRHAVAKQETLLAETEAALRVTTLGKRAAWQRENLLIAKEERAEAESVVREQSMAVFAETGDKAPHPAVKVKMYTMLDYLDGEALGYACLHLQNAVKLDKRKFEQAAKVLELDFVTITQEPRATIARDLSEYLPTE